MKEENGGDSPIAQALEGGIPQLLLGPAGKAISRLVGAAVEIPAGWLDEVAQASKDRKEAKSKVMQAIAEKTAQMAAADPKILERGLNKLLAKAYREQENREAVAREAVDQLENNPPPLESAGPSDDWLNYFEDHAAKASSESLRTLFASVLAGEVRKPGSFSLSTMHLMSVLDSRTASLINKVAPFVLSNTLVFHATVEGSLTTNELIELEDAGVITGSAGTLSSSPTIGETGDLIIHAGGQYLRGKFEPGQNLTLGAYFLTRAGKELLGTIPVKPNIESSAKALWRAGAKSVYLSCNEDGGKISMWMELVKPLNNTHRGN